MSKITGIFVPNPVPFRSDGSINEEEFRRMINWLVDKGVSGIYPNGSTGEFIRMSFEERLRVTKIVMEEVDGRVPVLAGAAEPNRDMVLKACQHCADLGCRAVSVTGPYYYPVTQQGLEAYFRDLAAHSPIDIIAYNIPQFANEISVDVLRRLALDCPRIAGTKDSSRDMPRFLNTLNQIKPQREDFSVLVGCEEILLPTLMMGGDGGTIATAGVAPEAVMKLYREFLAGNWAEGKRIQFKLLEVINHMLYAPNFPEGFRLGYSLRGFDMGQSRFNFSPQEKEQLEDIRSRLACLLMECGFQEAAASCQSIKVENSPPFSGKSMADETAVPARKPTAIDADSIVKEVLRSLRELG